MERKQVCILCNEMFEGFGNNARPLADGTCCDACNATQVLPVRMRALLNMQKNAKSCDNK